MDKLISLLVLTFLITSCGTSSKEGSQANKLPNSEKKIQETVDTTLKNL
jgi:hypothetical protein